jgi:hypothetical protein
MLLSRLLGQASGIRQKQKSEQITLARSSINLNPEAD